MGRGVWGERGEGITRRGFDATSICRPPLRSSFDHFVCLRCRSIQLDQQSPPSMNTVNNWLSHCCSGASASQAWHAHRPFPCREVACMSFTRVRVSYLRKLAFIRLASCLLSQPAACLARSSLRFQADCLVPPLLHRQPAAWWLWKTLLCQRLYLSFVALQCAVPYAYQ